MAKRTDHFEVRVEPSYRDRIAFAASLKQVTLTELVSEAATLAAEEAIVVHPSTQISPAEFDAIIAQGDEPSKVRKLVLAARRVREAPAFRRR